MPIVQLWLHQGLTIRNKARVKVRSKNFWSESSMRVNQSLNLADILLLLLQRSLKCFLSNLRSTFVCGIRGYSVFRSHMSHANNQVLSDFVSHRRNRSCSLASCYGWLLVTLPFQQCMTWLSRRRQLLLLLVLGYTFWQIKWNYFYQK